MTSFFDQVYRNLKKSLNFSGKHELKLWSIKTESHNTKWWVTYLFLTVNCSSSCIWTVCSVSYHTTPTHMTVLFAGWATATDRLLGLKTTCVFFKDSALRYRIRSQTKVLHLSIISMVLYQLSYVAAAIVIFYLSNHSKEEASR